MKRSDYSKYLVKEMTKTVQQIHAYQSTPRSYGTEDKLYMREAHFIEAVGDSECDIGLLADKLKITNGAVSQLAARLEKKELIVRTRSSSDSRFVSCALTPKAKKILEYHNRLDKFRFQNFDKMMQVFTDSELIVCQRFLEMMQEAYSLPDVMVE